MLLLPDAHFIGTRRRNNIKKNFLESFQLFLRGDGLKVLYEFSVFQIYKLSWVYQDKVFQNLFSKTSMWHHPKPTPSLYTLLYCNFSQHFFLSRIFTFSNTLCFVRRWHLKALDKLKNFPSQYFFRALNSPQKRHKRRIYGFCFYFWPPKSSQAFLFLLSPALFTRSGCVSLLFLHQWESGNFIGTFSFLFCKYFSFVISRSAEFDGGEKLNLSAFLFRKSTSNWEWLRQSCCEEKVT